MNSLSVYWSAFTAAKATVTVKFILCLVFLGCIYDFYSRVLITSSYQLKRLESSVNLTTVRNYDGHVDELKKLWPVETIASEIKNNADAAMSARIWAGPEGHLTLKAVYANLDKLEVHKARITYSADPEQSGKDYLISEGESLGPFTVLNVSINEVQLTNGTLTVKLHMFKPQERDKAPK